MSAVLAVRQHHSGFGGVPRSLNAVWIACHFQRKLGKKDIQDADIQAAVEIIMNYSRNPTVSLRVSGGLLQGIAHIYWRKIDYFWAHCQSVLGKISQSAEQNQQHRETRKGKSRSKAITNEASHDADFVAEADSSPISLSFMDSASDVFQSSLEQEEQEDAELCRRLMDRLDSVETLVRLPAPPSERATPVRRKQRHGPSLADLFGISVAPALPPVTEEEEAPPPEATTPRRRRMEDEHSDPPVVSAARIQADAQAAVEKWFRLDGDDSEMLAGLGISVVPGTPQSLAEGGGNSADLTPSESAGIDRVLREEVPGGAELSPAQMVNLMTAAAAARPSFVDPNSADAAPSTADLDSSAARSLLGPDDSPRFSHDDETIIPSEQPTLEAGAQALRLSLLSLPDSGRSTRTSDQTMSPTELLAFQTNSSDLQRTPRRLGYFLVNSPSTGVTPPLCLSAPSWAEAETLNSRALELYTAAVTQQQAQHSRNETRKRPRTREEDSLEKLSLEAIDAAWGDVSNQSPWISAAVQWFVHPAPLFGRLAAAQTKHLAKHVKRKAAAELRQAAVVASVASAPRPQKRKVSRAPTVSSTEEDDKPLSTSDGVKRLAALPIPDDAGASATASFVAPPLSSSGSLASNDAAIDAWDLPMCALDGGTEESAPKTPTAVPKDNQNDADSDALEVFSLVRGRSAAATMEFRTPFKTPLRAPSTTDAMLTIAVNGGLEVCEATPIRPPGAALTAPRTFDRPKRRVLPLGQLLRRHREGAWQVLSKEAHFSRRTVRVMECLTGRLSRPSAIYVATATFERGKQTRPGTASTTGEEFRNMEDENDDEVAVPVVSFQSLVRAQPRDVAAAVFFELLTLRSRRFLDFALVGEDSTESFVLREEGKTDLLIAADCRYDELTAALSAL